MTGIIGDRDRISEMSFFPNCFASLSGRKHGLIIGLIAHSADVHERDSAPNYAAVRLIGRLPRMKTVLAARTREMLWRRRRSFSAG